jgi:protein SCO1/2
MGLDARIRYLVIGALIIGLFGFGYLFGTTAQNLLSPSDPTHEDEAGGYALVDPPHLLADFTLTSHTGESLSLSELRGKITMLFFGYTHCPDVCPTTLADYTRVKAELGDAADEVNFVMVSVDGARDTPEILTTYLNNFDPAFIGMTGPEDKLRQLGVEYGLEANRETIATDHKQDDEHDEEHHGNDVEIDNYFIQHTSPSFVIDRDGYLRALYFYGTEPHTMAESLQELIAMQ